MWEFFRRRFPRPDWVAGDAEAPKLPAKLFEDELEVIRRRRQRMGIPTDSLRAAREPQPAPRTDRGLRALALSGGGIRSATFSLGILQALAKANLLKHFDYLSTVSGGGYIGGSLTWLVSETAGKGRPNAASVDEAGFPYGTEDPGENSPNKYLHHLREHGKYLTPGNGLTTLAFSSVILRGIAANMVLWLPVAIIAMALGLWLSNGLGHTVKNYLPPYFQSYVELAAEPWTWDLVEPRMVSGTEQPQAASEAEEPRSYWVAKDAVWWLPMVAAGTLLVVLLLLVVIYSISTRLPSTFGGSELRYWARRAGDRVGGYLMLVALLTLVVVSLPYAHWLLADWLIETGASAAILGALGGVSAFLRPGQKDRRIPLTVVASIAAPLLFYGLSLLVYWAVINGIAWQQDRLQAIQAAVVALDFGELWAPLAVLIALIVLALAVNLNYISVHRYYRDRLMEAFMPNISATGEPQAGSADSADRANIADFVNERGPYQVVNCNVVLVDSKNRRYRLRGGDNFILSPRYCGSTATGWLPTREFIGGRMSLATAVAISGAAVNPNTGVGGVGATRNEMLSWLMALLNVRLGYWIPHPKMRKQGTRQPNHFHGFAYEVRGGYTENRDFMQLSDGGHFENLGVYEMIRRKAAVIVCCDGGADMAFTFSDLQVLTRRIHQDFNARLEFDASQHLEAIIPDQPMEYPSGALSTDRAHIFGTIRYEDNTEGLFVLLKTAMLREVGIRLKGYKGRCPAFPHESTADQFFDEDQFEAYRELGYRIANVALKDAQLGLATRLTSYAARGAGA